MKRIWYLGLILVLLVAALSACSSARRETSQSAPSTGSAPSKAYAPGAPMAAPAAPALPAATAPAESSQGASGAVAGGPASAPLPDVAERKIILNAQFDLKVKSADEVVQKLGDSVRAAGGYVQETQQTGTKQQGRRITMNLRVPAGRYGPITDLVRASGEVTGQREWTQDVTSQYVDLTARLDSQTIHMAQLQKLYEKSGSIKELMDLETEIARVQTDIENIKGNLRVLDNQTAFSTVTVTLYEPGQAAPLEPPKTLMERIKRGFTDSWHGVVNFLGDLVVFVVSALPVLILLAIVFGIPGYFILRGRRGKKRPPGPGQEPSTQALPTQNSPTGSDQIQPPLFPK